MAQVTVILGLLISMLRNFFSDEVVAVIKRAIVEWSECAEDGWQEDERTNFVIAKAKEAAEATPNHYDDILIPILAKLYVAYRVSKGTAPAAPVA